MIDISVLPTTIGILSLRFKNLTDDRFSAYTVFKQIITIVNLFHSKLVILSWLDFISIVMYLKITLGSYYNKFVDLISSHNLSIIVAILFRNFISLKALRLDLWLKIFILFLLLCFLANISVVVIYNILITLILWSSNV